MPGISARSFILSSVVLGLTSCGRAKNQAPAYMFYGECTVEVVSKTRGADIQIDGISVGALSQVKVNIPCGEKLIHVVHKNYVPYRQYLRTTLTEPLRVEVELQKLRVSPEFALSKELLSQTERGLRPRDPWAKGPDGKPQGGYPADAHAEITVAKAATKSDSAGTQAAGGGEMVNDSVDNWR